MRFRALMRDQQDMKEFLNIILTLSKLTKKNCIMNACSTKVNFIINKGSGNAANIVWAEVVTAANFTEYAMEGVSEDYQTIMLTFNPSNLASAISVLQSGAKYCKLKLTNIQYPCLTIEMAVPSNSERYRQIVHNVPVNIIPRVDWNTFMLPQLPNPNIFLTLTSNRAIRNYVDKLKNLSPSITLYATSNGEMNIAAETEFSTITTRYRNLVVREINKAEGENDIKRIEVSCTVDGKKMAEFFSSLQTSTLDWSFGILDNVSIHVEIYVKIGVAIHCIIPAICM